MVTTTEELERAIEYLNQAKNTLRKAGESFDENIPIGIMVEVPSAAIMADAFVPLVDFFSIGSNDLTQYTLAVDRGNDLISTLYQELHPAVLKLIRMTAEAGKRAGKSVSLCGELGSYPLATPILVGMGIEEFSVSPTAVRSLSSRIKLLKYEECKQLADDVLANSTSTDEVKRKILQFFSERQLIDLFSETTLHPGSGARAVKK